MLPPYTVFISCDVVFLEVSSFFFCVEQRNIIIPIRPHCQSILWKHDKGFENFFPKGGQNVVPKKKKEDKIRGIYRAMERN